MDIKAFSNETRLRLIMCLTTPHNVTDLLDKCELSQSALSQHLKKLKDGGIVQCTREGNQQIYRLTDNKLADIAEQLLSIQNL